MLQAVRLPDAGHPAELIQSFFHKLSQGGPAPVAADDGEPSALTVPHPDRLLQAAHLDVVRQRVNVRQLVEIPFVAVQQVDVDVLDLLRAAVVQIGHRLNAGRKFGDIKIFASHHCTSSISSAASAR